MDIVEEGNRLIQFSYEGIFEEILDQLGQMPLPPYITHQLKDKNRYQTVYAKYDGSALYEYPNNDVGISEWGSNNFMHSRGEVRSFLQSCANYWLQTFHFDGLRMDAISRIIYWHGDE